MPTITVEPMTDERLSLAMTTLHELIERRRCRQSCPHGSANLSAMKEDRLLCRVVDELEHVGSKFQSLCDRPEIAKLGRHTITQDSVRAVAASRLMADEIRSHRSSKRALALKLSAILVSYDFDVSAEHLLSWLNKSAHGSRHSDWVTQMKGPKEAAVAVIDQLTVISRTTLFVTERHLKHAGIEPDELIRAF